VRNSQRPWTIIAGLVLVLATLAVYGQVRNFHFVNFDDNLYITDHPLVQKGLTLDGLSKAFTSSYVGFWAPLTMLSNMLGCQIFGLHPGGHHLINLVFHLANALLLFFWLQRTTQALGPSFLVAALFALHPLHAESVAWVTERKDVLSTFFWLLTMWAYWWYVKTPGLGRYLLILVCFILGLMAKPMLVSLPFVLLLLDYWPLSRLSLQGLAAAAPSSPPGPGVALQRLVWEKAPLFVLAALVSLITFYTQKEIGALWSLQALPFTTRLANALVAYVSYLGKMFWPVHLAVLYPLPGQNLPLWQTGAAALVLAALSFLALRQARRQPYLLVGWLWYLGTLVPVIGLVQVGQQAMADRYTYVPFIGLFIALAWGAAVLAARWRAPRFLLPVGAGVVLSVLAVCTWAQVGYWRDSITLYEHTLQVTRRNPLIHYNLGLALFSQGRLAEAMAHYDEALRLKPGYAEAHNNLGLALFSQGKLTEAMANYAEALRLKPGSAETHNNLGLALFSQGKLTEAMAHYGEALRLKPDFAEAQNNLGIALYSQGKLTEAMAHYTEALRLKPDFANAYYNLGIIYGTQGKFQEAIALYRKAIEADHDFVAAYNSLGIAYANLGENQEAVTMFQKAIQIKPNHTETYNNFGWLLAKQGKVDQAIAMFQKTVQIDPHDRRAQEMLRTLKTPRAAD
jgi:tetratricopeptide (TPR) repeat protein